MAEIIGDTNTYPPFSVVISVYKNDNPQWFDIALNSIIEQTIKPKEIILVVDGPIPLDIEQVVVKYSNNICSDKQISFKVIRLTENRGLGEALRVAIEKCSCDLIARMDSDDIAVANRFELQLKRFLHDHIDICGGQIEEFIETPTNVVGKRVVPETDKELKEYSKRRCPFNHVTVMYRKVAVLEAGNYQDWFWNEDYFLWIRMALKQCRFANVPETLVRVRVGKEMYARRGGKKYFKSEIRLQKFMLDNKLINFPVFLSNCIKRFIVQLLLPNSLRGLVFRLFARS